MQIGLHDHRRGWEIKLDQTLGTVYAKDSTEIRAPSGDHDMSSNDSFRAALSGTGADIGGEREEEDPPPLPTGGPFIASEYISLPGDRLMWIATDPRTGICCAGRETMELAVADARGMNAAYQLGKKSFGGSLTIDQALEILDRSERGRAVAAQLYTFLSGPACSLDMNGKAAVMTLVEEFFLNRPASVLSLLSGVPPV